MANLCGKKGSLYEIILIAVFIRCSYIVLDSIRLESATELQKDLHDSIIFHLVT